MAKWKGKTRGGVWGHKIFVFLIQKTGLSIAYFILRFVALYFVFFTPKAFPSIYHYFRTIQQHNPFVTIWKIYKSYYTFGQVLIDKIAVLSGLGNKFTYHFDGEENLQKLASDQEGALLIGAHVGNWEIAGHFLTNLGAKINIVMFDAEHQQVKNYLSNVMVEKRPNIIALKKDFSHIFELSKALKNKEFVCIHGDRFLEGNEVVQCDFLGHSAYFPAGPFQLASRLKIPYTYTFAMKESNTHYHFFATPPKKNYGDVQSMVEEYAAFLEKIVRQYPEQWFNYYDFWIK